MALGQAAIAHLDAADFNDAMSQFVLQTRRFGIEKYLTQVFTPSSKPCAADLRFKSRRKGTISPAENVEGSPQPLSTNHP
jgi:hypothetical protein